MARTPHDSSFLTFPLACLARLAVRAPVAVVAISISLAVAGGLLALGHLKLKTSRLDLINPESGFNRLWLEYLQEFGDDDEVIVVVSGDTNADVIPALNAIQDELLANPKTFANVLSGVDLSAIRRKALHYLPTPELNMLAQFVGETSRLTHGHTTCLSLPMLVGMMSARLQVKAQLDAGAVTPDRFPPWQLQQLQQTPRDLERLTASLVATLGATEAAPSAPQNYVSPWGTSASEMWHNSPDVVALCSQQETSHFLFPTPQGVIGIVLLRVTPPPEKKNTSFTYAAESIRELRHVVAAARKRFPATEIGITGMIVIENDEMQQTSTSMTRVTILSLLGVGFLFIVGFGGFRHAALAVFALLIAFGWTMVYLVLGIGHLNILSMAFGVILIGLGIDFGIHYVSRYLRIRQHERSPTEAIVQAARSIGPGVVTGALTTAAAFYWVGRCEFTGIAELGMISSAGVIMCCIAAVFLLPSMIQLVDAPRPTRHYGKPIDVTTGIAPFIKFPRLILFAAVVGTTLIAFGTPRLRYDHNLLNLHAEGEESVVWERRLLNLESGGKNTWFALSIANSREELLDRKKLFAERYPELIIDEIVSFFPDPDPNKTRTIADVAAALNTLSDVPPRATYPDLAATFQTLRQLQQQLSGNTTAQSLAERIRRVEAVLSSLSQEAAIQRIAVYQSMMTADVLTRLRTLQAMASPQSPTFNDLPAPLVSRFVSRNGKHLMRIYTKADIWNMDEMEKFVHKIRDIDPAATGSPLQTYEASLQMQRGYTTAAFYAFIAVCALLFLDLRRIDDTLLALSPMVLGTIQTAGILGWLDIPLNPANMIALPLILGIGIDDGVHIVHDARLQRGKYRLSPSTATSIVMTSLTTMVGFGTLMLASHQGLQSLGRVLVIGVTCAMAMSLIVLPAYLRWRTADVPEPEPNESLAEPVPTTSHTDAAASQLSPHPGTALAAILTFPEPDELTEHAAPLPTISRLKRRVA